MIRYCIINEKLGFVIGWSDHEPTHSEVQQFLGKMDVSIDKNADIYIWYSTLRERWEFGADIEDRAPESVLEYDLFEFQVYLESQKPNLFLIREPRNKHYGNFAKSTTEGFEIIEPQKIIKEFYEQRSK